MPKHGPGKYTPEEKDRMSKEVDKLVASGKVTNIEDACEKVGFNKNTYFWWKAKRAGKTYSSREYKRREPQPVPSIPTYNPQGAMLDIQSRVLRVEVPYRGRTIAVTGTPDDVRATVDALLKE